MIEKNYQHIFKYSLLEKLYLEYHSSFLAPPFVSSFKIIGFPVLEKRILKVFTIYGHGGHLGHVTRNIYIHFLFPFTRILNLKFGFDWQCCFREEDV